MKLSDWWFWFKSLHLSRKWFIIFILIRPVVDNFYQLKEVSALSSPLYIVGVLTPVFIAMSFLGGYLERKVRSAADILFTLWSFLVVINCFIFYSLELSVVAFGDFIKYTTPVMLYFYCRSFIRDRRDLHGILTTFLLSCLFPFGMLFYELIFNPIAIEYISTGRGGGSRIRGGYGDIMNYAIYIVGLFIVSIYYFLEYLNNPASRLKVKPISIAIVLIICFVGLTQIKHVSTWSVFLVVFLLMLIHNLRNSRGAFFVIGLLLIVLPFFAQDIYNTQINPLIEKEIKVVEGESSSEHAFNGRMTRWEKYFEVWQQMPPMNHFFGISTSHFKETVVMIGAGMHSDYVRILFLSGIVGLVLYVLSILVSTLNYFRLRTPEKFLLLAMVASTLLWSVTTIPTLYAPFLYILYPVLAFSSLSNQKLYST